MEIINILTESFLHMGTMDWVIFIIAFVSHLLLAFVIIFYTNKSQNCTSWFMWLILEFVLLMSQTNTDGSVKASYAILLGYFLGSLIVILIIIFKKQLNFEKGDIKYAILTIACCAIWYFADTYWSVISSTLALEIPSLLQFKKSSRKPEIHDLPAYFGFWVASFFTFVSANNIWTVPEKFYPVASIIMSTVLLLPLVNKFISRLRYDGWFRVKTKKNNPIIE